MLVIAPSPARAEPPTVEITGVSSTNIASGERTTLKYSVTNPNRDTPPSKSTSASIRVDGGGMSCSGECSPVATINPGESREFTATLTAPGVDPGATKSLNVQVTAILDKENASDAVTVTVRGPEKPKQVRQISGRVSDQNGRAVSGAQVFMQDSADHKYETTSNGDGGYAFTSSDDRPITPGAISVGAGKDGFKPAARTVQAAAGKTVNAPLTLSPATVTPSATPSADTATPIDEATDGLTEETDDATAGVDPQAAANEDSGSGSLLFIILGGLLVAAGVGAIVLVLMRRKGDNGDDDDNPGRYGVVPPGPGRYNADATRIAAPAGGLAHDPTMVASISGGPSMADAPTMLQRPVPDDDEFPDPYGAPAAMPQAAYGAAAYGAAAQYGGGAYGGGTQVPVQSGGYDDGFVAGPPTQYGRPAMPEDEQYGGYAQQGVGGYGGGEQQRYDEPTGMYRAEPAYDQGGYHGAPADGGYRAEPEYPPTGGRGQAEPTGTGYQSGGYGQAPYGPQQPDQGGYGSWGAPGGGIDSGSAYGPTSGGGAGAYGAPVDGGYEAPGRGTYGGGSQGGGVTYGGGYGDQNGYGDQGGYDPRGTYGRPAVGGYEQGGGQQGGYGPQGGGYEQGGYEQGGYGGGQGGGRHGGQSPRQPQESNHPSQRRSVDWLDD